MMRNVALLVLLSGVTALKKPSSSDIMRMTLKSRSVSDVSLDMETDDVPGEGHTTREETQWCRAAFAMFVVAIGGMSFGTYKYIKGPGAIEEQQEEVIYNKVVPIAIITLGTILFFSVIGGIVALNDKAYQSNTKTNFPGYEGKNVAYERIDNPGERAFFTGFALITEAIVGLMICLYLRKQQNVQMSISTIMKMILRGAIAGTLATVSVEFIRLPFHDYMSTEELVFARVMVVFLWVGFVACMEEVLKLSAVVFGLNPSQDDAEAAPSLESAESLAICGLAAGVGFAVIENIPRMYALALEPPLAEIVYSMWGDGEENFLVDEGSLRAGRVWTFVFWGLLNIQPWLTGLAALKLAQIVPKGPIAPMDFVDALKVVFLIHCFFDLFDRSAHPLVEFLGCCAIPYAMYTFKKQWQSLQPDDGLLADRQ